jgi:hypothetical protein
MCLTLRGKKKTKNKKNNRSSFSLSTDMDVAIDWWHRLTGNKLPQK